MSNTAPRRYTARYIFPGDAAPIENGTVEITGGTITAVINRRDSTAEDLGCAAIIPGLVNAHTHLEFSELPEPLKQSPVADAPGSPGSDTAGSPFTAWIRSVVKHRSERPGELAPIIRQGIEECARTGTTLIGDIATDDDAAARYCAGGPHSVVFRELLGFTPQHVEGQLKLARRFLETQPPNAEHKSPGQRIGLSPHAPYSVHPGLFRGAVQLAAEHNAPVAMHIAETQEERQLLHVGTGPLRDMLERFGVWQTDVLSPDTRPMDYLRVLSEAPAGLVIHGNYLDDDEQHFTAHHEHLSLVFCPRTHAAFRHPSRSANAGIYRHPWRNILRDGGNVALGTDSRASNPDLSLWNELGFLRRRHPEAELPDVELLRLATINGARALRLEDIAGSLTPGKSADLAVVALLPPDHRRCSLFDPAHHITAVMCRGTWTTSAR